MTVDLAELGEPRVGHGPHYGFQQRYLLRLPGDKKARLRTRVTTFIKTIDDASNLIPWASVMAMCGLLKTPALRAEMAALLAAHPDPYYDTDDSKARAKDIAERAKEAGGGGARRDTGTALHDIIEAVVTGRATVDQVDDEFRWHVIAVLDAIAAAGYEPVPSLCERSVYHAGYDLCGKYDVMLRRLSDGALVIGDYKTGGEMWQPKRDPKTKAQTGWYDAHSASDLVEAAQLATYASADHMIVWPEDPWDVCGLEAMPAVDQSEGIIIHAPSTGHGVALRRLDLRVGRAALELCKAIRDLRRTSPLIERIGDPAPDIKAQLRPAPAVVDARRVPPPSTLPAAAGVVEEVAVSAVAPPAPAPIATAEEIVAICVACRRNPVMVGRWCDICLATEVPNTAQQALFA